MRPPLIIAVDCDGTLWYKDKTFKYPGTGTPRLDIIEKVKELKKAGAYIILWTCRAAADFGPVIEFCKQHEIIYDKINKNYREYSEGFARPKIFADYYIDDQSLSPESFVLNFNKIRCLLP